MAPGSHQKLHFEHFRALGSKCPQEDPRSFILSIFDPIAGLGSRLVGLGSTLSGRDWAPDLRGWAPHFQGWALQKHVKTRQKAEKVVRMGPKGDRGHSQE